jgi:hypothetical protein
MTSESAWAKEHRSFAPAGSQAAETPRHVDSMSRRRQRNGPPLESPRRPTHHVQSERPTVRGTSDEHTAAWRRQERDEIDQLAAALRAAKRAHAAYVAELRQADVEPAEDWSMWYAEYLFGQR